MSTSVKTAPEPIHKCECVGVKGNKAGFVVDLLAAGEQATRDFALDHGTNGAWLR